MTQETKDKIDLVLLALEWNQRTGHVPPPGHESLTAEFMEAFSERIGVPVSARTWRRIEQVAIGKLAGAGLAIEAINHLRKPIS